MRSRMSVGGHPIHPMLVPIPIGLFVFAFVADLVYLARNHDPLWFAISFWCTAGGVVGALAAAVPGFGDYFGLRLPRAARRTATVHMVLNLGLVVLYGVSLVLMGGVEPRVDSAVSAGDDGAIALHGIGVLILAVSGWLGGDLVYRHRVGVEQLLDMREELEAAEYRPAAGAREPDPLTDETGLRKRRDVDH